MMGSGLFGMLFTIAFVGLVVTILVTLIRGIGQWSKNNQSPVLTVDATVVAKRANVSHHHHAGGVNDAPMHTTSTTYYATFQVASGDRMELKLPSREYGMLAEGDQGRLTFQGTRYHSFQRL